MRRIFLFLVVFLGSFLVKGHCFAEVELDSLKGKIYFSEILVDPVGEDKEAEAIEFTFLGEESMDVVVAVLKKSKLVIMVGEKTNEYPLETVLFQVSDNVILLEFFEFQLANKGAELLLVAEDQEVIDRWSYGKAIEGKSWQRFFLLDSECVKNVCLLDRWEEPYLLKFPGFLKRVNLEVLEVNRNDYWVKGNFENGEQMFLRIDQGVNWDLMGLIFKQNNLVDLLVLGDRIWRIENVITKKEPNLEVRHFFYTYNYWVMIVGGLMVTGLLFFLKL